MRQYSENQIREWLESKFDIEIRNIKFVGNGYDSEAYLINEDFIFKFAKHELACKDYLKEKKILDFLRDNLETDIKIPEIEYFSQTEKSAVMGYKAIHGTALSLKVYQKMNEMQKEKLAQDIAHFLKQLHCLNIVPLLEFTTDNQKACLEDSKILKAEVYNILNKKQKNFIESIFAQIISNDKIFNGKKALCHNDLSGNHILLNENYELAGVIDFGDACVTDIYCDFLYLLEKSEEEIEREFGLKVLKDYGLKEIETVIEYADLKEEYYPIETLLCGIKNNSKELWEQGLQLLKEKTN